ncbi:MAG: hypothetical protein ACK40X_06165, partial [Armatimonadota bacterium]
MLRLTGLTIAIIALALAFAPTQVFRFSDDFSQYPAGSVGEPNWDVNHIGFEIRDGELVAEIAGGRGNAVLTKAPIGRIVNLEAVVTVHRAITSDWKIAGVGIYLDERNFWHVALVESPD